MGVANMDTLELRNRLKAAEAQIQSLKEEVEQLSRENMSLRRENAELAGFGRVESTGPVQGGRSDRSKISRDVCAVFDAIDLDRNGLISKSEFQKAFQGK